MEKDHVNRHKAHEALGEVCGSELYHALLPSAPFRCRLKEILESLRHEKNDNNDHDAIDDEVAVGNFQLEPLRDQAEKNAPIIGPLVLYTPPGSAIASGRSVKSALKTTSGAANVRHDENAAVQFLDGNVTTTQAAASGKYPRPMISRISHFS